MKLMERLGRTVMGLLCRLRGEHDWFPNRESEFLCLRDVCLRCTASRVRHPTGMCMYGHPMAWHFDAAGTQQPVGDCPSPQ
jgi:hypothetical protein